jgi:aldose 1-epimerase
MTAGDGGDRAPRWPSGAQFELRHGAQRAVVAAVGATLRAYEVAGQAVVDGFPETAMASGGRGQVLLPWPNRIAAGRYVFEGETYQLPLSEVDKGNAIHGLCRWLAWTPREHTAARLVLETVLYPQPGYPFLLGLEVAYALADAGLAVTTAAHNLGARPLPFGAGQHPYFRVGTMRVDTALLQVPAASTLTTDARAVPTGRAAVAGTPFDFRAARPIGALALDTCFADLATDADGQTRVQLAHPDGTPRLTLTLGPAYRYVQVFTGDTLADPASRRRGVAIEPMTCPANAFNSGEGLAVLAPGATFTATWAVSVV